MGIWQFSFVFLIRSAVQASCSLGCQCEPTCPPLWTQFDRRCFRFFAGLKTYDEAETHCRSFFSGYRQGHLASVHRQDDNHLLSTLIRSITLSSPIRAWLGANDKKEEGTFVWSDGSPWDYDQAWGTGHRNEPEGGVSENCVAMSVADTEHWFDASCGRELSYICSLDATY